MAESIYICYFGVREPLVQTQVIPYLKELVEGGHKITLLTFEPAEQLRRRDAGESEAIRKELAEASIEWRWLRYHKRPSVPATLFDVLNTVREVRRLSKRKRFEVLHARGHVPAVMAALSRIGMRRRPKLLFDIRGFLPEEYADAGVWSEGGWLFRTAKRFERWLMREADGFVVLTEKARETLFPESKETGFDKQGRPVEVIPCCVDLLRRFSGDHDALRVEFRERLGIENRWVMIHLGALGGLYLVNEIADLLAAARERNPATFALFLTQSDPKLIRPLLSERGFLDGDLFIGRADPADIEGYLHASDVGLSIVKASFATLSRSPTKIAEYLACGLPIIANAGVGDLNELIEAYRIGALIRHFDEVEYDRALAEIEAFTEDRKRVRAVALSEFGLQNIGGIRYRQIYSKLLN